MKYTYKNFFLATKSVVKRSTVEILCMVVIGVCLFASGCERYLGSGTPTEEINTETPIDMKDTCEFENPLTDIPWLVEKVDEITLLFQNNPLHIAIYQCGYSDGKTGFLEDRGNVAFFYNCEGEMLCAMGGCMGSPPCQELSIDFASKNLIWEINN